MSDQNYDKLQEKYEHTRDLLNLVLDVNDHDFLFLSQCTYEGCRAAMCSRQNDWNPQYLNCKNMRDCVCGYSVCDNHNIPGYDVVSDEEPKLCIDCLKK